MMDIPLACPRCNGKMYVFCHDVIFNILKKRSWHICKSCNFLRDAKSFQDSICTV